MTQSQKRIAKNAGLSLTPEMIEKLDALNDGKLHRSAFVRELMIEGLVKRFGLDWELIAAERQQQVAA